MLYARRLKARSVRGSSFGVVRMEAVRLRGMDGRRRFEGCGEDMRVWGACFLDVGC